MLKFDRLGPGANVVRDDKLERAYMHLLDEVKHAEVALYLKDEVEESSSGAGDGAAAVEVAGTCRFRHVGTGVVAEGRLATTLDDTEIEVAKCTMALTAVVERPVPKDVTVVDLSKEFKGLTADNIEVVGSDATVTVNADGNKVTLSAAPAADGLVSLKITFEIAAGKATTLENAAKVNVDAGDYQIHFIARARDDMACTHMPNPTMLEFIKHCRPLNIRW